MGYVPAGTEIQLYTEPPDAVRLMMLPGQIVVSEESPILKLITFTVTVSCLIQPPASVRVT